MQDHLFVNPRTNYSDLTDETMVSFVPMTNVQEKTNQVHYDSVPYSQVKKGFTVFQRGDLIWAKITPCMQNGKSCIVDGMPTQVGFGSTEFHVIRKRNKSIYMPFIWAIFSNENVLKAAQATFSGSAGQQRVSASFLEDFPAVLPDYDTQVSMVKHLEEKLAGYNNKIRQADGLMMGIESEIAQQFGFPQQVQNQFCFAIRFFNIDGVIDVKRYSSSYSSKYDLTIADVCDVLDSKINVTKFHDQTIDLVRIDDLPNFPLDIEQTRTQPASELMGSYFQVRSGDILVARLGPTILNQKIVMIRHVERETVVSPEFLVLRCKKNHNPETVMAILRTHFYRTLMYSQSRGSTPSRYRLNRDDMLGLPFPKIKDELQKSISERIHLCRNNVKTLQIQAEQEWQAAKEQFEKELLGG